MCLKSHQTFFSQWLYHFTLPLAMWEFLHILTNPCLFSLIFFFIIAILMSVEWYLTAVFIFIYLMIDGIEYNHFYWILDIVMIALLSVWVLLSSFNQDWILLWKAVTVVPDLDPLKAFFKAQIAFSLSFLKCTF